MMSLGKGDITSFSIKQKIQVKRSTEDYLIGIYYSLPQALCAKYSIESQGYTVGQKVIYQDNKSAIILEVNSKLSSPKRTKHIKTIFFSSKT